MNEQFNKINSAIQILGNHVVNKSAEATRSGDIENLVRWSGAAGAIMVLEKAFDTVVKLINKAER